MKNLSSKVKITFLIFFLQGSIALIAQPRYRVTDFLDPKLRYFSLYSSLGTAAYFGDLCPTGNCFTKVGYNFGFGAERRLNDYLGYWANMQFYRISNSDASTNAEGRLKRNLSFRADNFEFTVGGKFEFLNYNTFRFLSREEFPISMYTTLGFGFTTNNPKAQATGSSEWVNLRKLETENNKYSVITAVIPFGLGISYKLLPNLLVGLDGTYRWTFTDYLDDVSTNYVKPSELKNPKAIEFADRSPSNIIVRNYDNGSVYKRGNPNRRDGYLIFAARVNYILSKDPFGGPRQKSMKYKKSTVSPIKPSGGGRIKK